MFFARTIELLLIFAADYLINMTLEANKSYIQKNPLFGRKLIHINKLRESVWGWDLCNVTLVTIDKEPSVHLLRNVASSIYDHQGLSEIPNQIFNKSQAITKLYEATRNATLSTSTEENPAISAQAQETLGKIISLLYDANIIDENTYDAEHLQQYAKEYDCYSREQMERVTDVIDVHK